MQLLYYGTKVSLQAEVLKSRTSGFCVTRAPWFLDASKGYRCNFIYRLYIFILLST